MNLAMTKTHKSAAGLTILWLGLPVVLASAAGAATDMTATVKLFNQPDLAPIVMQSGSLVLADFDGDGTMDAAVPGTYIGGVAILFNAAGPVTMWVETGNWPVALAAGDFDDDGDVDLAVANQDDAAVMILDNPGDGHLVATAVYAVGRGPQYLVAQDIDGDDRPDLLVANRWDDTVTVLRNTGSGFAVAQTIDVPAEPNALAVADLDKDNDPDIAVACAADDSVRVLLNNGGTFAVTGAFPAGPYPVAIAAADLDKDGDADLVAVDREYPQVTVLLNDGAANFTSQDVLLTGQPLSAFTPPVDLVLADFDADGDVDIRAAGRDLLNDGAGGFTLVAVTPDALSGLAYDLAKLPALPGTFLGRAEPAVLSVTVTVNYLATVLGTSEAGAWCDWDGSGTVDVFDIIDMVNAVVLAFGTSVGEAAYDARFDFDANGLIDIIDVITAVERMLDCFSVRPN